MSPKESIYKNFTKENLSQLILTLTNKLGKYYLESKEVTKEEFEKYLSNKVKANASGKDELIQLLNELDVLWVKSTEESSETIKKLRLEIEGLKQVGKDMSKGCSSKEVEDPKGDMSEDTMGTQGGTPNSKMVPKEGKAMEDTKSEYSEESVSTDSGSTVSGSTDTEVSIETEKVHGESFKMIKISQHVPTYKGTIDEDLDDWIFVVEASLGREVGVDGLNAITPLLKGRALSILKNFRSENPHTGWLGFKKVLKQNFDREDNQRLLRTALREVKCYGRYYQFLAKFLSIKDKIVGMQDYEAMFIFMDALNPLTKRDLVLRKPATFNEAVRLASLFEENTPENLKTFIPKVIMPERHKTNYLSKFPKQK